MLGLTKPAPLAFADYYASIWRPHEIDALVPDLYELPETTDLPEGAVRVKPDANLLDQLMLTDLQRYLPHDILTKVDRASMAVSLEVRVPLLDHRIVQFALKLPLRMKWRNGMSKYLLRQILYRHVPRELIDRPKHGFGVPLDKWLRGDLHQLINQYLNPSRLKQEGLFDPNVVQYHVDRFMAGRCGHARVWSLLMFQMWSERYVERCVS
jgi:asparagine synthase (glutamine-hydrolysing)